MTKQEKKELDIIYRNLLKETLSPPNGRKRRKYGVPARGAEEGLYNRIEAILFQDVHSRNVAYYCYEIGLAAGFKPSDCLTLFMGGMLHDIGKGRIPDEILTKPSRLTPEEYEIVKQHPKAGYDILRNMLEITDETILAITLYHHERFDGKGYPFGLKGEDIPLVARIAAVADSFDAMTSNRVYQKKRKVWEAVVELRKGRGTQFDPDIVNLFVDMIHRGKVDIGDLLPVTAEPVM